MPFSFHIAKIMFSGGEELFPPPASMLILLGPNNSGKSTALREIAKHFSDPAQGRASAQMPVVVLGLEDSRGGTADEFVDWLSENFPLRATPGDARSFFATTGAWIHRAEARSAWGDPQARAVHQFLIGSLGTEDRLTATKYGNSIPVFTQPPARLIHAMQARDSVDLAVREQVRAAFRVDLLINRAGGSEVGFHVGDEPPRPNGVDRVSDTYAEAVMALPRLDDQGDGLRSYVGTVLAAFCGPQPILLIDEPEAFLHPPQARRLASVLAKAAVDLGRQIFVATHSAEVVEGAVAAGVPITICRITREENVNRARSILPETVTEISTKPILRSAAVIDGLFHSAAVVCESDGDCRIYEAVVRRIERRGATNGPIDAHFVHGGGKGALTAIARTYFELGVPVAVVADIDLLREPAQVEAVVGALGADWQELRKDVEQVSRDLQSAPARFSDSGFRDGVAAVAARVAAGAPPDAVRKSLRDLADGSAPWSGVKRTGIGSLRGAPRVSAESLLDRLRGIGLFVVPVGELEGWYPDAPPEKSRWFVPAIEEIARADDTLPELDQFGQQILKFFGYV